MKKLLENIIIVIVVVIALATIPACVYLFEFINPQIAGIGVLAGLFICTAIIHFSLKIF